MLIERNNIKMNLKEIEWESVDRITLLRIETSEDVYIC
jgi:hypothetical protein